MAKQTVSVPVAAPLARKATGGKPIANTTNLKGLAFALAAFGRQSSGRASGGSEMRLLDGTTYDQLAEQCLDQWNAYVADQELPEGEQTGVPPVVVLVEGQHFKMDSKLKSIKARIQRALAGGSEGDSRKDEMHTLKSFEVSVKAFDATPGFKYLNPETGKMEVQDIPNTIYIELNPGIAEKAAKWAELNGGEVVEAEDAEEVEA